MHAYSTSKYALHLMHTHPPLQYIADLLCLDAARPLSHTRTVTTPLRVPQWQRVLLHHPDRFRIGHRSTNLTSATGNMSSALLHPGVIDSYIQSPLTRTNPTPYSHQPYHNTGKWRIITEIDSTAAQVRLPADKPPPPPARMGHKDVMPSERVDVG